jgi:NADPH-dependent glutamate synthase beta subunit-like oxidoreductase/NAD(P)H-flavin reductase
MATASPVLELAFGLRFAELHAADGLARLDAIFLRWLEERDAPLAARLTLARQAPDRLARLDESGLLLDLARPLEAFLGELFGITAAIDTLRAAHTELDPFFRVKRKFVQRQAARFTTPEEAASYDGPALRAALGVPMGGALDAEPFDEAAFATHVAHWMDAPEAHADALELAKRYAAWAVHTDAGRRSHRHGVLFKTPQGIDPEHLVPAAQEREGIFTMPADHLRRRRGFALTDAGADLRHALDQAHYCIWCHPQGRDSCSKGMKAKGAEELRGKAAFKTSPFGASLTGCPLEEKISEFHQLKAEGVPVGALAVICVDNPLAAATGHRICNDCMKACIYQKQQPVDIPQIETRTLRDVLQLPWGFEVYALLTRWNPLNLRRPLPRPPTGKRVLVVGMGPAGFSLAHHLMNDGHLVAGIDGLKIEPLDLPFAPIHAVQALAEDLDRRVMAGFGGVAEYGITVRWDKNFLKIVRLLLERRRLPDPQAVAQFALFGGVRFGGTLTAEDAFAAGFDHVALAIGAGKPTTLDIPNGLARGVRAASDFLMALQLTGAAKADALANLQVRLPAVVVGGGLTAIDTATEALAYYPVQVEKFLARYERLCAEQPQATVRAAWNAEEAGIADEFLVHARALRAERAAAAAAGRPDQCLELLQSWGGVTIAYRKRLLDSPSYTLNHEEVEKALEEGIRFAECLAPEAVQVDAHGAVEAIRLRRQHRAADGTWTAGNEPDDTVVLPARSLFVAAGTQPNTVPAREDPVHFQREGRYLRAVDMAGATVPVEHAIAKPAATHVLTHRRADGRFVSVFGDVHPSYFGNVVKAMASARNGYPIVTEVLSQQPAASALDDAAFVARLRAGLTARVFAVRPLAPRIVEVIVHAPYAARAFRPGQFYRLQNFETVAAKTGNGELATRLQMEGIALTGAWVDADRGLVSTIVLEMGGSSDLCRLLRPGEPVVLMGPTGAPTEIPSGETVVLAGGGLGNAVLFSIGAALRAAGSRVLYFAGYKKVQDRYKVEEIEAAADTVVWCCDEAPGFAPQRNPARPQDKHWVGNIVEAMLAYAEGRLGAADVDLRQASRLIVIGSDRMMAAVAAARHGVLAPHLDPAHVAIGSINSPMQCMMKEICAQCLQRQVDPATGEERVVFSCFNQDQALDAVDWAGLNQRLRQNAVQEKLTAQWIRRSLG